VKRRKWPTCKRKDCPFFVQRRVSDQMFIYCKARLYYIKALAHNCFLVKRHWILRINLLLWTDPRLLGQNRNNRNPATITYETAFLNQNSKDSSRTISLLWNMGEIIWTREARERC
jgi:hypothetical protein